MKTSKAKADPKYQIGAHYNDAELTAWATHVGELVAKVKPERGEEYKRVVARLTRRAGSNELPYLLSAALTTTSSNSWFVYRAALLHHIAAKLVTHANPTLLDIRAHGDQIHLINQARLPLEQRKRKHSKRRDIDERILPKDWIEQLIDGATARWQASVTILAATGSRPAEVTEGVLLERQHNGQISVRIKGAKVGKHSGHQERTISFPVGHRWYQRLSDICDTQPLVFSPSTAKGLSDAVLRIAKRLWPRHRKSLTAYCLRHALATEVKRQGYDQLEVAVTLGHRSTRTQKMYGGRRIAGASVPQKLKITAVGTQQNNMKVVKTLSKSPTKRVRSTPSCDR